MNLRNYFVVAIVALLMLVPSAPVQAGPATVPPTCDQPISGDMPPSCTEKFGPYADVYFLKTCPTKSGFYSCFVRPYMPPAEISCGSVDGLVMCDAFPQSPTVNYTYTFVANNGVQPGYTSDGPTMLGNCTGNSGRVTVTVYHPDGRSSTASTLFSCDAGQ